MQRFDIYQGKKWSFLVPYDTLSYNFVNKGES